MSTNTRNVIAQIFLQISAVLIITSLLTSLSFAKESMPTKEATQPTIRETQTLDSLFLTKGATDFKQYQAADVDEESKYEIDLVALENANVTYHIDTAPRHLYAYQAQPANKVSADSWPLLSVEIQREDVTMRMGSTYQK